MVTNSVKHAVKERVAQALSRHRPVISSGPRGQVRVSERWIDDVKREWRNAEEAAEKMSKAAGLLRSAGRSAKRWSSNLSRQGGQNAEDFRRAGEIYESVAQDLVRLDKKLAKADRAYRVAMSKADIRA